MLWLAADRDGLALFYGDKPPVLDEDRNQFEENDDPDSQSEYIGNVSADDAAEVHVSPGECVAVKVVPIDFMA